VKTRFEGGDWEALRLVELRLDAVCLLLNSWLRFLELWFLSSERALVGTRQARRPALLLPYGELHELQTQDPYRIEDAFNLEICELRRGNVNIG